MRGTIISVHNNQSIEVFVKNRKKDFEVWLVSTIKEHRQVLAHHITHDDLEGRLRYEKPNDLVWKDVAPSEIPDTIHPVAKEAEDIIKRGAYADYETKYNQSLAYHIIGIINVLALDRKEWNKAMTAIIGKWTDGIATVTFDSNARLDWICPIDRPHPFNSGLRGGGHIPDWWSFSSWQLHLMNNEHKSGMRIAVLRVDEQELHISNEANTPQVALIFQKVKNNS